MRRMNYLGFATAAIAALAMSCGGPSTDDGGSDAGADAAVDAGPGQTLTFVLDQLAIDMTDSPDVGHTGFNLDDKFSTIDDMGGCMHDDFFSLYDNDQHCTTTTESCTAMPNPGCAKGATNCRGGVDNQLPALANIIGTLGTDVRQTLQDTISNNKLSLVVRISGVNDMTNDSSVHIALYLAYPTFSSGCTSVTPGREYTVARSSVMTGATDINTGAAFAFDGSITNGRLQFTAGGSNSTFNLPLSVMGLTINLPLHALQVRFNLGATELTNGSLGGWVAGSDIISAVAAIAPSFMTTVAQVIGGMIDIQIGGTCGDQMATPPTYGGIALGLGVHAVPATISTTTPISDAAAPGTCGYAAPTDGGPRG